MTELFLDITLLDFGGRSQARAKRMAGELEDAFDLAEIAANAYGKCVFFTSRAASLSFSRTDPTAFPCPVTQRKRAMSQLSKLDPGLDCGDRASRIGRAAADLDLSHPVLPRRVLSIP
jgi:hypothetical protein